MPVPLGYSHLVASRARMQSMNPLWTVAPPIIAGMAGITAYGAVHPSSQLFGASICKTGAASKLAITFDDGPNPSITPRLLELLERHNAKASFFVVGRYVRECPGLLKEIHSCGHVIGNHTDTHPNLFFCGPQETRYELQRCKEAILSVVWENPRWFRPPFGYRSPWLGAIVHELDMRMVTWSLLPGDWRLKPLEWLIGRMQRITTNAQRLKTQGKEQSQEVDGDILCLHDGNYLHQNGDRSRTLSALEYWLPRWRDLGLEFVTMNQAFGKEVEA
jgi:peptidoglycan/xylan/chitin deacetylase (PgdA/CDA1 family)